MCLKKSLCIRIVRNQCCLPYARTEPLPAIPKSIKKHKAKLKKVRNCSKRPSGPRTSFALPIILLEFLEERKKMKYTRVVAYVDLLSDDDSDESNDSNGSDDDALLDRAASPAT